MTGCGRKIGPYKVVCTEFIAWAKVYDGPKFHAVFCDPPYGLEFMGKEWDAPWKQGRTNDNAPPVIGDVSIPGTGFTRLPQLQKKANPRCKRCGHYKFSGTPCDCPLADFEIDTSFERTFQEWTHQWASALIPLLYPGALVFCFGGTRTWHRLACGFEDAGFQIWDTIMWLHGQGFPKAQDISKLIDKANGDEREVVSEGTPVKRMIPGADQDKTGSWIKDSGRFYVPTIESAGSDVSAPWSGHKTAALKPAWEPVLCFKAPTQGKTYAEVALEYGSGALNVDGGRIDTIDRRDAEAVRSQRASPSKAYATYGGDPECERSERPLQGRYPANLALDEEAAAILDEQTGILVSGKSKPEYRKNAPNNIYGKYANDDMPINVVGDSGGASRFFYCAKASRSEREAGMSPREDGKPANDHPTVKPLALCRWLATLLLPPESVKPRRLLVPFSGSGSEMIGALQAGWDEVVGIEQDEHYCEIARARLALVEAQPNLFEPKAEQLELQKVK